MFENLFHMGKDYLTQGQNRTFLRVVTNHIENTKKNILEELKDNQNQEKEENKAFILKEKVGIKTRDLKFINQQVIKGICQLIIDPNCENLVINDSLLSIEEVKFIKEGKNKENAKKELEFMVGEVKGEFKAFNSNVNLDFMLEEIYKIISPKSIVKKSKVKELDPKVLDLERGE